MAAQRRGTMPKKESLVLVVYMGEDIGGPANELPTFNTLKGQSQHTLQIKNNG